MNISLQVDIGSKTYANGCQAIEHLAFSAQRGEFIAIVGPSGAGKTTLLNLVAGLDREMHGSIVSGGSGSGGQARIGFMFQEPRLMPWLTVRQNLALVLPPALRTKRQAGLAKTLDALLASVGLPASGNLFPGQLSGGMQRRVALLRAFIVEPEILLMDEPFQSLDAPTAAQLRVLLQELWQRTQPTILFVTHSLREALCLADRVLFLSARPSRVILDLPTRLPHSGNIEDPAVQAMHAALLAQHPGLLQGHYAEIA